jgi:hypothetical protein
VKVHCDEGVAIHIGPKPCVIGREAGGEASAGERAGQPSSRESERSERRRRLTSGRQHGCAHDPRARVRLRVVLDPGMYGRSLHGNRELSRSTAGRWPRGPRREGDEP